MDPKCPFSLPFSLPSGDSSKKPTREWEPLSEPKVTPACLRSSLCRGLGAGAAAEHGASPPRRTLFPAVPRSTLGLWTQDEKEGYPGAWTQQWAVHVSWAVGAWRCTLMACEFTQSGTHICSVHVSGIELCHRTPWLPLLWVGVVRAQIRHTALCGCPLWLSSFALF